MFPLLTVTQMRQCDEYTIHTLGVPSQVLMERAARAAIEVLYAEPALGMTNKTKVIVLCGCGNNGVAANNGCGCGCDNNCGCC